MSTHYDVVVIGAGSGGLTSAVGFTKVGKRVLLIEKEHMGGECTNSGCIPSKSLLHHAKSFHQATMIAGATPKGETYRMQAFNYVRHTIDRILAEETPETFIGMGIDVVIGEAVLTGTNTVRVSETTYQFTTAIIATGSNPRLITIAGLEEADVLTNQNIFTLDDVPERLLVIGGGPIGLEMAQAFAMLGSDVTIVERSTQFAQQEDPSVRPVLRRAFEKLGITILTGANTTHVSGNTAHIEVKQSEADIHHTTTEFDKVLVAIGRVPNLPSGLSTANIERNDYGIIVDNQQRTTNKNIYALGDVANHLKFTHTADDIARQVVTRVVSRGVVKVTQNKAVPKVTYTQPEMAQVGLSWNEAKQTYVEDRLMRIKVTFDRNDRAKTDDCTDGVLVLIVMRLSGRVLGAHIVGPAAGEILSIFTLAIDRKISVWKLQRLIFAYPTYGLIVKKAADQYVGQQFGDLTKDLKNLFKRHAVKLLAGILWSVALVTLSSYHARTGLTTTETSVRLFEFLTMTAWGPALYVLIYAIRPVTFFPATALTILAGIFYGLVWGTILTLVAATLAAAVSYAIGRFFGNGIKLEHTSVGRLVKTLRTHTFTGTLVARLSFLPFDLVSYAAGIIRVSFIPFIVATFIGIILGTATFVAAGASLDLPAFLENGFSLSIIRAEFLVLSVAIFLVSIIISQQYKK